MRKGSFAVWMALLGMVIVATVLWFGIDAVRRGRVGTSVENLGAVNIQPQTSESTSAQEIESMQEELDRMEEVDLQVDIDISGLQ